MTTGFITKGRGAGRKVIPIKDRHTVAEPKVTKDKSYNKVLWQDIVTKGRKREPTALTGGMNHLDDSEITTIVATMEFFDATDIWMKQTVFDLGGLPRFRVFDWLAMNVMGRNDDDRRQNEQALKVLVHAWTKADGDVKGFIRNLREDDYDVDRSWEKIQIDI
ncbi:hypothetical protein GQ472_01790 [archaeon]|nr:hypothetical protein [archaeon]